MPDRAAVSFYACTVDAQEVMMLHRTANFKVMNQQSKGEFYVKVPIGPDDERHPIVFKVTLDEINLVPGSDYDLSGIRKSSLPYKVS